MAREAECLGFLFCFCGHMMRGVLSYLQCRSNCRIINITLEEWKGGKVLFFLKQNPGVNFGHEMTRDQVQGIPHC